MGRTAQGEKAKVLKELQEKGYRLRYLLKAAKMSKSTYYFEISKKDVIAEKNVAMAQEILEIFTENKERYGVRRVYRELLNRGKTVNHKRVQRIMHSLGLFGKRPKEKYHSYKGEVGKIAANLINRDFSTTEPYQKLGTDVTVFITPHGKLYLSPVIDFHTREILSYDLSEHPNMKQIRRMLEKLIKDHGEHLEGAIMHSDQGWQYQMLYYRKFLQEHKIVQSMSRKGNCLDNSPTENFFGRLKTDMYYDKEYSFKSLSELKRNIRRYIRYYNEERIVTRLRTNPHQCRNSYYESVV